MNETQKTLTYLGAAVVLVAVAFLVTPSRITPEAFQDQGEQFFPDFTDPNAAMTLEVIEYDEESGSPRAFKVTFDGNRWTIPSHYNYPADAEDRLAKTAAGIIDIRKDDFRTDNVADHEATGVIDPLDEAAGLKGRGTRVTIKGKNESVLADIIIGKPVEGRQDLRFVRLPNQKRVYASQVNVDLSTRFQDWIETDLTKATKSKIDYVEIQDYSIDERSGSLNMRDVITLTKEGAEWRAAKMPSGKTVDSARVDTLLSTLAGLEIVGVRPKPEGLSAGLQAEKVEQRFSQSDLRSLQSKGFFFTRDGKLVSNEGELVARTTEGVKYTLRFGEVVYGNEDNGSGDGGQAGSGPSENRYLFITTEFVPSLFTEPEKPENLDFQDKPDSLLTDADRRNKRLHREYQRWEKKVQSGREKAEELNERFADWYYVISSDSFEKLTYKRDDLIVDEEESSS